MVNVNIASSTYCLEGFINFDNSLFLKIIKRAPFLTKFLPTKYSGIINDYKEVCVKYDIRIFDCRKKLPFPNGAVDHALCSHYLEHLYKFDADIFLQNLFETIRPGGSAHIIVPDLRLIVQSYVVESNSNEGLSLELAAENLNFRTLLTYRKAPSFIFSFLESLGGFGLMHHFMYDRAALIAAVERAGFTVLDMPKDCPSSEYRRGDDSIHLYCVK
jgi:SAM-dependent methyltransferase